MTVDIALLRAINVAGNNKIAMADLRNLFVESGFSGARSLLQTGNVVFESNGQSSAELERLLEAETESRLGVRTVYLVRSGEEWRNVIASNPFPAEAERDPGHLLVMFLKDAPNAKDVEALQAAIKGPEILRTVGKQAYIVYPAGIGRSKLTNILIEQKLGCRGTGRNWNTILKLGALARP